MQLNVKNFKGEDYRIQWQVRPDYIRLMYLTRNQEAGVFEVNDMVGDYYGVPFKEKYNDVLREVLTNASEKWGIELLKADLQVA